MKDYLSRSIIRSDGKRARGLYILRVAWELGHVELKTDVPYATFHRLHCLRWALELDVALAYELRMLMGDFLRKALEAAAAPEGAVHFRDDDIEKTFPALYDFMASKVGPNGKTREGGCLIMYARDGEVTATLKDRALKRAWYGRSDGFWEALRALEASLKHDDGQRAS